MYNTDRKNAFLQELINQKKEKYYKLGIRCLRHGWGKMEFNHGCDSNTINLFGKNCSYGIGIHVPGEIEIDLNSEYNRLTTFVGHEKDEVTERSIIKYLDYKILGDGKELWHSNEKVPYHTVDIDVLGIKVLTLICDSNDGDKVFCHTVWGDLTLYSNDKKIEVGNCLSINKVPFSFVYDGISSDEFLYKWDFSCEKSVCEKGNKYKLIYKDPDTELAVILDVLDYKNDASLWWDFWFENQGEKNTKQISNVKVLDYNFKGYNNPIFHSAMGSDYKIDDFKPVVVDLKKENYIKIWTKGGRSTNYHMPYFNLNGDGTSVIGALGWSAQWEGNFTYMGVDVVNCTMGLENYVDFYLNPGEKLQMPSMALVFTDGDFEENQNDFRNYLVDYIIPRDNNGKIKLAPICVYGWGGMKTSEFEKRIEALKEYKLPYEYYWVDAGWYGPEDSYSPDEHKGDWAMHVGNWQVNPKAHPKGLRYLSDRFGEIGLKFLLWIEPERAICGTPITQEHPDLWLGIRKDGTDLLFNMADDKACDWIINYVGDMIKKYNIKCFREDYNFDPIDVWKKNDEEKRRGITEIKSVNNGYRFWKTLLKRYPDLIIDNCASGGRRLDINMAKMSFSLWRTDYQCIFDYDPMGPQLAQNWLALWSINNSAGTQEFPGDTFRMRACMGAGYCMHFCSYEARTIRNDYPYDWHRKMLEDYWRIRKYFYGNYYSLMEAKQDYKIWISYELYRKDMDEGCFFVFREKDSEFKVADVRLRGLDPDRIYSVEDLDNNSVIKMSGKDLIEKGLEVTIPNRYQSKLYIFKVI